MFDRILLWSKALVDFAKNVFGSIQTPYQTYRSIAIKPDYRHLMFVGTLILVYLVWATLVRGGLRASPFFLTASLGKVVAGVVVSYLFSLTLIHIIGRQIGGRVAASVGSASIPVLWGYTLIPTLLWFIAMSLSYAILPPPRTVSLPGQVASAVFIALSIALFWWKMILYYLTLRFGLRFSLKQILLFSLIFVPILGVYSVVMYKLGIFRVPFV